PRPAKPRSSASRPTARVEGPTPTGCGTRFAGRSPARSLAPPRSPWRETTTRSIRLWWADESSSGTTPYAEFRLTDLMYERGLWVLAAVERRQGRFLAA